MQGITRRTLCAGATLFVVACSGVGDGTGPVVTIGDGTTGGTTSKVLSATANGTEWTATTLSGGFDGGSITIGGTDGAASLQISIPGATGPGTWTLGPGNANAAVAFWADSTGTYTSAAADGSGVVTVTTATTSRITGSFSFAATTGVTGSGAPMVTVTAGAFDITTP